MAEIIDTIVVRVVADIDDAQRKVAAYGETAEEAFARAQKATEVGDAKLAQSVAARRAAFRELGQQISQVSTEAINGGDAFVLLGQHGIETAATLEKFGGTVGRVGSFLAGPWGVGLQLAVSVLGQLAGKFLDNDKNADAAAAAMGRFQRQQSDIGRFIDPTTGKIKEQNAALLRNAILTKQREIDQRNRDAKQSRKEAFDAVRALAEPSIHGSFLQRLGAGYSGVYVYDRQLQDTLRTAGGDIEKLEGLLAELVKKRPKLKAVAEQVTAAASQTVNVQRENVQPELFVRALSGDDAALTELVRLMREAKSRSTVPAERPAASIANQNSAIVTVPAQREVELSPAEIRAGIGDPPEQIPVVIAVEGFSLPTEEEAKAAAVKLFELAGGAIDLSKFEIVDTEAIEKIAKISGKLTNDLSKGLVDAIAHGKSLGDVLVDSFARAGEALIQAKILQLLDPAGDGSSGFIKDAANIFGSLFGTSKAPGRASGGHVSAGQLYRVNEAGIEGFRPAGSGTIVPLGQMAAQPRGGGVTVIQPLNVSFAGAVTTPELMAEFKAYADNVGQAAAIGGAAMAQTRMARRAARALPR